MAGDLQPLVSNQRIVNDDGTPTQYFMRWAQEKQIDIGGAVTAAQVATIVQQYMASHNLVAGSGISLTNGGNIDLGVTIAASVQAILDQITTTRGSILFRGAAGWQALAPGTAAQVLQTGGAGADPSWVAAGGGGGGGLTTVGLADLTNVQSPGVGNYLMKMIFSPTAFTISKIAFFVTNATPTTKLQVFVYASTTAGAPGALLGSSVQVTGVTAGYNEIALVTPVALTKGQNVFVGASVITAGLSGLWVHGSAWGGFAGNGGSTAPSNPAPGLTFGQPYGFWGVA